MEAQGRNYRLFGLAATTPEYKYRGRQHLLSVLNQELDFFEADQQSRIEYVIFTGVNQQTFLADFIGYGVSPTESYFSALGIVLVKMESSAHAVAHERFRVQFCGKMIEMGVSWDVRPLGQTLVQGEERRKRADASYRPAHLPRSRPREWPTLVVETAFSESSQKLQQDIRWWLGTTQGGCCIVTINIDQRVKKVAFEKWVADPRPKRDYRNVFTQERNGRETRATSSDPMVIKFEEVLLTQPTEKERDFVFQTGELRAMAEEIWGEQYPRSE